MQDDFHVNDNAIPFFPLDVQRLNFYLIAPFLDTKDSTFRRADQSF